MAVNLIGKKDIAQAAGLRFLGGEAMAGILMKLLNFDKVNQFYDEMHTLSGMEFIDYLIQKLEIKIDISETDLARIPRSGSFITVSNHPYGGIDGILLLKIISHTRPDFRVMANFLLQRIEPISDMFFGVNPFEDHKSASSSLGGIRRALTYLAEGNALGIFPAGEVSTYKSFGQTIADREWQESAMRFIKKSKVPVVPVYFSGYNSAIFHFLGLIHPALKTARLPSELFNKKNKTIKIRIGNPISVRDQAGFDDIGQYGRFLRLKTYALGRLEAEVKPSLFPKVKKQANPEPIAEAIPVAILRQEIDNLRSVYLLFDQAEFSVFCAPYEAIPNIIKEIGRQREIAFRDVGEGTNRSLDLDEYDLYYDQLFIWDNQENLLVGGYRFARGRKVLEQFGIKGFYVNSLFRISEKALPLLNEAVEVGRSFVVKDYQAKPLSLFFLWKGIVHYMLKHEGYRYLFGTVSISNNFSDFSKELIMEFIKLNFSEKNFANLFTPRTPFKSRALSAAEREMILDVTGHDLSKLDRLIQDIEPNYRIPVLIRKYLQYNAKIMAFNVDPSFNDCLDGLVLLDMYEIPLDIYKFYMKEHPQEILTKRFRLEG